SLTGARYQLFTDQCRQNVVRKGNSAQCANQADIKKKADDQERAIALCDGLISLLSETLDIPSDLLRATSRCGASVARARQTGMYLAHVSLGLTMAQVASGFARNKSTVVHACHTIEDLRDDDAFDAFVARQERIIKIIQEGNWNEKAT
ncbi:MAG: helix-turn-helix domain-containing protein, partial [Pseudomonadota bacterium]